MGNRLFSHISIYDPKVRAEARANGITELQAYRRINARAQLLDRIERKRAAVRRLGDGTGKNQHGC